MSDSRTRAGNIHDESGAPLLSEIKVVLKKEIQRMCVCLWGGGGGRMYVRGTAGASWKSSQWPKLEQFEQGNN